MKKLALILFIFSVALYCPVMAEGDDLWSVQTDNSGYEAKPVSDEEFEEAFQKVDKKVNKWRNWAQRRHIPRGKEFSQSNETELINNEAGEKAQTPVICVPVELQIGEGIVPIGHYQVRGETVDGRAVLGLYQGHNLIAKIPAYETGDDFDQDELLFAKLIPEGEDKVKIIYGSLDLNAYTFVNISK